MPFADSPTRATGHRRPDRRVVTTAAAVVLALVAAGCGAAASPSPSIAPIATPVVTPAPSPTAAPTASPAPTASAVASQAVTGRIVVSGSGFAITLPDGWESIPVDPAQLQAFLEGLPAGSELRTLLEGQAGTLQQAIKFWAFDVRPENTAGGFARNVNIIVQPPTGISLATIEGAAKGSLESISAVRKPVTSELVELPAGPALKLDYILDVAGATGNVAVAGTQYYVQMPTATLIVSFSTDLASKDDATKDFDAIADSIESVP